MKYFHPNRSFVTYIDRSREYYAAQGYPKPYAWAHYDDAPFTPLLKPLSKCRVGLVTTAVRPQAERPVQLMPVREVYAERSDPPPLHPLTDDLGGTRR
jgi:hypothetical protein